MLFKPLKFRTPSAQIHINTHTHAHTLRKRDLKVHNIHIQLIGFIIQPYRTAYNRMLLSDGSKSEEKKKIIRKCRHKYDAAYKTMSNRISSKYTTMFLLYHIVPSIYQHCTRSAMHLFIDVKLILFTLQSIINPISCD